MGAVAVGGDAVGALVGAIGCRAGAHAVMNKQRAPTIDRLVFVVLVVFLFVLVVVSIRDHTTLSPAIDSDQKVFAWLVRRPDEVIVDALNESVQIGIGQVAFDDQHPVDHAC